MAEQSSSPFSNESKKDSLNNVSDMLSQVRSDIDDFVEGFDVKAIAQRVEEFGKANPVGLALTALTIGVAAGILMRGKSSTPFSSHH